MPRIVDMKQYNAGGAVKYQLLPGKLRPNVGGALAYNRRAYSENGYEFRTSDAVDAGLLAGVDLQLTNTLSVGFDFRYMMNIGYRHNTSYPQSFVNAYQRNEIEKLDYYTATLAAKLQF
jgi:hypothetical protein